MGISPVPEGCLGTADPTTESTEMKHVLVSNYTKASGFATIGFASSESLTLSTSNYVSIVQALAFGFAQTQKLAVNLVVMRAERFAGPLCTAGGLA